MTEDQARHVYKMVEMDKVINVETMKQEIEDHKMTRKRLKEKDNNKANPYQMAIIIKHLEVTSRQNKLLIGPY